MTWTYTGQVVTYLAAVAVVMLVYLRWLAWDFDRRWGKEDTDRAREPDPAE